MTNADELELYMLELINEERTSRGLTALQLETNLNQSAENHSNWMLNNDVFSHDGVDGSSSTDRMRDADFNLSGSWGTAENIAIQSSRGASGYLDDVADLHTSLMNSSGHRANLLNPDLEYIGIGIEVGSFTYGSGYSGESVIVTQNFARTQGSVDLDTGAVDDTPAFSGSSAADTFLGTANADEMYGFGGNDILFGHAGDDLIEGGNGNDVLIGGTGADELIGGAGNDALNGQGGDDMLFGGAGTDRLNGSAGNDTLDAGDGVNNVLDGGAGSDTLIGSSQRDIMRGQAGQDTFIGGGGNDTMDGGFGRDQFIFNAGDGNDIINGFELNFDVIDLSSLDTTFGDLAITAVGVGGVDAMINYGSGLIRLRDTDAADISADDFVFDLI